MRGYYRPQLIHMAIEINIGDFEEDEIIEYIEDLGYTVTDSDGRPAIEPETPPAEILRFDSLALREHLISILGCGHYVTNNQIISLIKESLS